MTRMLYIQIIHNVPVIPHCGAPCTAVCSNSNKSYIYYTSACSNAHSLGAVYGVFIANKNVIYIILQHVPMLPHWGRCTMCS